MTYNQIAKYVADREGKRQELSIAQIKEVLSILSDLFAKLPEDRADHPMKMLLKNGNKRKRKVTKKK